MSVLEFTVPWGTLCSDNRKFVAGYRLSKEYRDAKEAIGAYAMKAARLAKWERVAGAVALEVVVREPDRRKRDLNWSKNAKDGISESQSVWWDDSQVRWELWRFEEAEKWEAGATVRIVVLDRLPATGEIPFHATLGRPRDVQPAPAPRPQRQRRVRGGAATADQPTQQGPGHPPVGRRKRGTPRGDRAAGALEDGTRGQAPAAGPVRAPAKGTGDAGDHDGAIGGAGPKG